MEGFATRKGRTGDDDSSKRIRALEESRKRTLDFHILMELFGGNLYF